MERIVVGVDGSAGSQEALRFAVREASLRDARLRAVTAWHVPAMTYAAGAAIDLDVEGLERNAEALLDEAIAAIGGEGEGVEVERVVREGQPAHVLVEETAGADLLVVGSRGHGGFVGLVIGSVSQQCAHCATCPVVIVPKPHEE